MKKLELNELEILNGGELTEDEIDTFLGVGGCLMLLAGGVTVPFGGLSCLRYILS